MRKQLWVVLLLALSPVIFYGRDLEAAGGSPFLVIVNAQNPINSIDRKFLADLYLKKVTHWPKDGVIQPVDLKPDSPARSKFSEAILDRSVMGVKSYWQQLIFSGQDVPPPELKSDNEVIHFVLKNPSSIGYISSTADISSESGIKTVSLE